MRSRPSLTSDERAIEGLPIRLVIALVVGVASLAIMMQMLGGLSPTSASEVDINADDELMSSLSGVSSGGSSTQTLIEVVDDEDLPVENTRVVVESGTAEIQGGPIEMGMDGASEKNIQFCDADAGCSSTNGGSSTTPVVAIDFRSNQDKGTIKFDIIPPSDSDYEDTEGNTEIVVMK